MTQTFKGNLTSLFPVGWSFVVDNEVVAAVSESRTLGATTRVTIQLFKSEFQQLLFVNGWRTSVTTQTEIDTSYIDSTVEEE